MQNTKNSNSLITVTLFGNFELSSAQGTLDSSTIASDKITTLLSYLIQHHSRAVPTQELYEVLWREGNCKNPPGALKNLIYRCRTLLRKFLGSKDYIVTTKGSYIWNPDIPILIDCETFENYIAKGCDLSNHKDRIPFLEEALNLYTGKFLSTIPTEYWINTLATYYHGLFLKGCKYLIESYDVLDMTDEMITTCKRSLPIDSLDETLHYYMMKSYVKQGNTTLAIQHYEQASKELSVSLGIISSPMLDKLYNEILSLHKMEQTTLEEVAIQLQEPEPSGAFVCDFGVFKNVYRIEARRVQRLGILEHILLFTIEPGGHAFQDCALQDRIMKKASSKLESLTQQTLRIGDVITKISDLQFVVLLPDCSYSDAAKIASRICNIFYSEHRYQRVKLIYHLDELSVRAPYL